MCSSAAAGLYECRLSWPIFKLKTECHCVETFDPSKGQSEQRPTSALLAFPLMSASSSLSSSLSFLMQSKYSFCLSKAWPQTRAKTGEGRRGRGKVGRVSEQRRHVQHTCSGRVANDRNTRPTDGRMWQHAHAVWGGKTLMRFGL